jgi:hypothetical protein
MNLPIWPTWRTQLANPAPSCCQFGCLYFSSEGYYNFNSEVYILSLADESSPSWCIQVYARKSSTRSPQIGNSSVYWIQQSGCLPLYLMMKEDLSLEMWFFKDFFINAQQMMDNVQNKEISRPNIIPSSNTFREELYYIPDNDMKYVKMCLMLFNQEFGTHCDDTVLYPRMSWMIS